MVLIMPQWEGMELVLVLSSGTILGLLAGRGCERILFGCLGKLSAKASLEVIITDCFNLVSLLNSCSFKFVSRTCNRVAYVVAKYVISIEHPTT